jgi:hypothetical protein
MKAWIECDHEVLSPEGQGCDHRLVLVVVEDEDRIIPGHKPKGIVPNHKPKGAPRIARYEPVELMVLEDWRHHHGGLTWFWWELAEILKDEEDDDNEEDDEEPKPLMSADEETDGDPRFAEHAPHIHEIILRKASDEPTSDELNELAMIALTWLAEQQAKGKDPVSVTSHWIRPVTEGEEGPDFVCKRVAEYLDAELGKEQAIKAHRITTDDGEREWTHGDLAVFTMWDSQDSDPYDGDDNPEYAPWEQRWNEQHPNTITPESRKSADDRLGYGDDVIVHKDHVKVIPYPKREALADLFRLVMSNAHFDDILDGTTKVKDIERILDRISLKVEQDPSITIDNERTQAEVAKELGMSQATVSRRLKAFKKLWESKISGWVGTSAEWSWRPTSEELAKHRTGASGGWGSRKFRKAYPARYRVTTSVEVTADKPAGVRHVCVNGQRCAGEHSPVMCYKG